MRVCNMEWMGSVMETYRQSLSHIGVWHDGSVSDQDMLQLADRLLYQRQSSFLGVVEQEDLGQ